MQQENEKSMVKSSSIVAKAGIWYTVCNFLFRGMAFITTPVFARLMSKEDLGSFSNLSSWLSILMVLTSFDFAQSVIRSKLDHKDDMDSYIWSLLSFTSITTILAYIVVCIFSEFFTGLFEVEKQYIHVMFFYLLVAPAYQMLITKHRAFYKYKSFVMLTGIMIVSSTLLSLGMVIFMQNKLAGRIYGHYLPHISISCAIYVLLALKGKRIKVKYWKYACVICLPLVPHVLSLTLLSASDKILLTKFHGVEVTAVYSIAYSCYHIATILFDSLNKAWAPWLMDSLHAQNYGDIKKVSRIYVSIFVTVIFGLMLVVPELVLILGGRNYMDAVYCLPPLMTSCVFQLVYTMYVNVEFFRKKTIGVACATILATSLNIMLDLFLLPRCPQNCLVIAAYTTLAGYVLLFVLHYLLVKRMKMAHVFDIKFLSFVLVLAFFVCGISNWFYSRTILRYLLILTYGLLVLCVLYKFKDNILKIFAKNRNK